MGGGPSFNQRRNTDAVAPSTSYGGGGYSGSAGFGGSSSGGSSYGGGGSGKSHEGWLTKKGLVRKNWKRRYFSLDNNRLSYHDSKDGSDRVKNGSGRPLGVIEISNATAAPVFGKYHHCFQLKTAGRVYFLHAASNKEYEDWKNALASANVNWNTRPMSMIMDNGNVAPAVSMDIGTPTLTSQPNPIQGSKPTMFDSAVRIPQSRSPSNPGDRPSPSPISIPPRTTSAPVPMSPSIPTRAAPTPGSTGPPMGGPPPIASRSFDPPPIVSRSAPSIPSSSPMMGMGGPPPMMGMGGPPPMMGMGGPPPMMGMPMMGGPPIAKRSAPSIPSPTPSFAPPPMASFNPPPMTPPSGGFNAPSRPAPRAAPSVPGRSAPMTPMGGSNFGGRVCGNCGVEVSSKFCGECGSPA
eukprot:TRINITY_DN3778_c0_g1_i1.p1 TRINITY_DN3778_c0_g1~~TRINITY_DN3778_c0_g1_i1.p1  ORF type:complete len:449 (+),score=108.80 TRINITY_DN3778_c0_g1_i1:127-1347(+)